MAIVLERWKFIKGILLVRTDVIIISVSDRKKLQLEKNSQGEQQLPF
jgi:hypothetical protein